MQELAALKADIEHGLADVEAGRVRDFNVEKIVERGKKLSTGLGTTPQPGVPVRQRRQKPCCRISNVVLVPRAKPARS